MINKILQHIADNIIKLVSKAKTEKELELIYSMGLHLDDFAIRNFNIYLD